VTKKQLDSQALHILNGARDLIADPAKWTQGCIARDAAGEPTGFIAKRNPVCFCSLGALSRAMWDRIETVNKLVPEDAQDEVYDQYNTQYDIVYDYLTSLAGVDLVDFNDSLNTHHSDIVNLFDLAIDNAEERVYE
jgi:hypothetical protein